MTLTISALKTRLHSLGCYSGIIDEAFDAVLRTAILRAMSDGPDLRLTADDFAAAATRLGCDVAAIMAVRSVEASANPFLDGKPAILFEPHRFSKATGHRFDASHPTFSSRTWNRKLYPATQAGRWGQLLAAAELDVDAAFASASYGAFQILGENFAAAGARDAFAFAWQESQTEADQLAHFEAFVKVNGLVPALRRHDWAAFARGYNGTAFASNHYDTRLAAAWRAARRAD